MGKDFSFFKLKLLSFWVESRTKDKGFLILEGCRMFLESLVNKDIGLNGFRRVADVPKPKKMIGAWVTRVSPHSHLTRQRVRVRAKHVFFDFFLILRNLF